MFSEVWIFHLSLENVLHPIESVFADKRFLLTLVDVIIPADFAVVEGFGEQEVDSANTEFLAAPGTQSYLIQLALKTRQGVVARGIPFKHLTNTRRYSLINDLCSAPLLTDSFIAKRGFSWKPSLSYLFFLSLAYLF
ncbi:MAG: hypothetical protein A3C93_05545 [Candidatus Lloydbacteria bacterium RIFCSPHIGHO2_02_FULL_54_17]|uniref:Uncharacterized protein n=1 Tax=Candidatus Lloydbacteria bacterium RIFCSPHIGHO2_02_FULL_54_17 TaxID=1798664 RepID=A0A1G2DCU0_9BACT|nr:MAG: hypothetical protein A3C93_05545 [Candidatus Lloydbacteria bacterium RIFCSPHIGHO2_02_FULL_54_17]OGZ13052.1 MAG: hypothetical protein A2948_03525 [Candidatus Lloydbacteria bacterium RIFCSPLOWO2_01_FULL_54_18]OGZ16500.1 MAG: hypothetical protein A3H76_04385 [Candidatus Lloydbacteria bacterium RIFCSPLOWO2_02_FULL_54_12]